MSLASSLAVKHLLKKRTRTILGAIGIASGVVIYIISSAMLGRGQSRQLIPDFLITGPAASKPYDTYDPLDATQVSAVLQSSLGIGDSFPVLQRTLVRHSIGYVDYVFSLVGLPEQFIERKLSQHLIEGRIPKNSSNEVLVGYIAARSAMGRTLNGTANTGQKIYVPFVDKDGKPIRIEFVVAGLLDPDVEFFSTDIIFPLSTLQSALNTSDINGMYVYLNSANLRDAFAEKFGQFPHQNISIRDLGSSSAELQTLNTFAFVTIIICVVSGLRSTLGNVSESLTDIGILKALGMTASSISLMFFVESLLVSIVGGLLGVILGLAYFQYTNSQIASSMGFSYPFLKVYTSTYLEISVILVATSLITALIAILVFTRLSPSRVGVK